MEVRMSEAEARKPVEAKVEEIDAEVADILHDMIGVLCDLDNGEAKVEILRGQRLVVFIVTVPQNKRGLLIGHHGASINALRAAVRSIGATYKRQYDIDPADAFARKGEVQP